ncbi:hypothetical protein HBI24_035540 [Parastagonospora nodorum]|nr:hypothetical protein HBI03_026120 [Parastagonospora nodorum]KAH4277197.1 hypothetical protein HBI04_104950 [Parastagonospora nodorum]KAH4937802.1 hypothetical protein HBI79_064550 [Parastagonospora nodorum]KAH5309258.1 hypothetical protein HBI11_101810 [Parastagonospora nodorum]KAH5366288.1 hypothetical protein HBI48_067420 [Parastagonospora nodorum]
MGRQAYLAKLAFGRSAFEPTQEIVQSDDYIQLDSPQAHLPQAYQDFNGNNYLQLYDERGNPINPRSREYGKKFRNAQNDVLAAVGVVERRQSPDDGLPGSYEERLDELDVEDTVGLVLGATFTLSQNLCTWWIGTIRDRILTFRFHDAMPFAQLVALEHAISGPSIMYASFVPTMVAAISAQTVVYNASVYRPIARLMDLTHASSRVRYLYRLSKNIFGSGLRLALEAFFYPFYYHAILQRLGLVPALPYLPHRSSLNPFSTSSPLWPFSVYHDASASFTEFAKAVITSPMLVLCGEHLLERWVYDMINEAVDTSVICPDNPDIVSASTDDKHRIMTALGLRRKSPPFVRAVIERMMMAIGWGTASKLKDGESHHLSEIALPHRLAEGQTVDIAGTTIANVTPLDLTVAQPPSLDNDEVPAVDTLAMSVIAVDEIDRPRTPMTPPALDPQYDDDDPRIRITSREDVVEMEVRLPQHILSAHTEVADALASSQTQRDRALTRRGRPHHRVSHLSLEASDKISHILKSHLVGLAVLPFKIVALRLVASHYLSGNGRDANLSRVVVPLPRFHELSWQSVGIQASRLALCSMLHIAVDLSLWGAQYVTSVYIGKNLFGWGTL